MAWKGSGITTFVRSLKGLKQLAPNVAEELADDIYKDLQQKYGRRLDPYGNRWRPRKIPQPWPLMKRSGRLYGSLNTAVRGSSIIATRKAPYARFHQTGTKHLPIRLVVPSAKRGIPKSWNKLFRRRVARQFKRFFK